MRWTRPVGSNIRRLREARRLSQADLAHEANVAIRYLGGIERAEENPSLLVLIKIADALGVEPALLLVETRPCFD